MSKLPVNAIVTAGLAVVVGASLYGMNGRAPVVSSGDKGHSSAKKQDEVENAVATLQKQLMRRFTDRQNVQFGYSRMVRRNSRMHEGPTMGMPGIGTDMRQTPGGTEALDMDGNWKLTKGYRPQLHAENDDEKNAVTTFNSSHRDVGLYTFGLFDNNQSALRLKGPAVLNQFAGEAPPAASIKDLATRAWRTGMPNYHEVSNGWTYYFTRVDAPDKSCVSCHQGFGGPNGYKDAVVPKAVGDHVGMFVIAVRNPDVPVTKG